MSNNKPATNPARANRGLKPVPSADGAAPEKKERKPRASTGGDFNAELRALADKHRKKSAKLRNEVAKLEQKLATKRSQLNAADAPLQKVERVLADNPELPGLDGNGSAVVTDEQLAESVAQAWPVTPAVDQGEGVSP